MTKTRAGRRECLDKSDLDRTWDLAIAHARAVTAERHRALDAMRRAGNALPTAGQAARALDESARIDRGMGVEP